MNPTAAVIAGHFIDVLKEWTGDSYATICERNSHETDSRICHSHDCCDANMAMEEAFGRAGLGSVFSQTSEDGAFGISEKNSALWNQAWGIAKVEMVKDVEPKLTLTLTQVHVLLSLFVNMQLSGFRLTDAQLDAEQALVAMVPHLKPETCPIREFEVQTLCGQAWDNCWAIDDVPQVFQSLRAAFDAIDQHLADVKQAVADGDMDEEYDAADYRVVGVITNEVFQYYNPTKENQNENDHRT